MAISCVTAAVLGHGKAITMAYTTKQKIVLNKGDTFLPKSNIVPCNLACAKMAKSGIITVVIMNPMETIHQSGPDLKPKRGGKIKFPAPKNPANKAKPNTKVSLVLFIVWLIFD
ncbi:hypothetical protein GCM10023330_07840 [Litoribaculum gwangyangense]|uniref:Uncharacterized protein n=1 Tax=Litoribaculum gwangyangense TaxID=1130722 RepID=A0ABP9C4J4_9FLAO